MVVVINSNNNDTGMAKTFNDQYYLDVIGTSTVVQEQSHVPKMSTNNLRHGELQKVI
jgi:hypothetical protein